MFSLHPTVRRTGGLTVAGLAIVALVVFNVAALPAAAQATCVNGGPELQLANPNPGDLLPRGDIIISGTAFDPAAAPRDGVSRVDLFLGQRDGGGLFLGSAVPVLEGFQVKVAIPDSANGGRDFVAYAYANSGQETSVSVPVFVGEPPTPTPTTASATPVALTQSVTSTCAPAPAAGTGAAAGVTAPVAAAATAAPSTSPAMGAQPVASATDNGPVLQLSNPSEGDLLPPGDVVIQGLAYDTAATDGAGVDRVELFLDSRDNGGTFIGGGVPTGHAFSVTAKINSSINGGHNLVAYARSSVTGRETVVSVPIFVGVGPTPTPRPTTNS